MLMFDNLSRTQTADPLDLFNMWNCIPALSYEDEQSGLPNAPKLLPTCDLSHDTVQCIHFSDQRPFSNTADGWITRELPDCDQVLCDQ
jgi:hypothetical protein